MYNFTQIIFSKVNLLCMYALGYILCLSEEWGKGSKETTSQEKQSLASAKQEKKSSDFQGKSI